MRRGLSTTGAPITGIFTQRVSSAAVIAVVMFCAFSASAALPPVVTSFVATPPVIEPGGLVTLTVSAYDPDCATVCTAGCGEYIRADLVSWSAIDGTILSEDNGASSSPYTASAVWQAPLTEGTYTVSVYLADSGSFMCGGRQSITPTIDITVSLNPNQPPLIDSVTADPLRIFPGENSVLTCSATDPEGDRVRYSWSTDSGSVVSQINGSAIFTADEVGIATVTCTASDGQASSSSNVILTVSGAIEETSLTAGLTTPMRIDVTSWGDVYTADRSAGGISVVNLFSGEHVYDLKVPGITSVAVDWNDNLLVGAGDRARVIDRAGRSVMTLDPGEALGPISDVAVDSERQFYGVLFRKTARVVVFDSAGRVFSSFGSNGDSPEQLKGPQGLAANPLGEWVVADSIHGLIKIFDETGRLVRSFGGLGGGVGEFVQLDDVEVDEDGRIYASDSFQDWVQVFDAFGNPLETVGSYGDEVGHLKTAAGIALASKWNRLLVASINSSSVQVYQTDAAVLPDVPQAFPEVTSSNPAWNPDKNALDFGPMVVGGSSQPVVLGLRNIGKAPLGLKGFSISGGFVQSNSCGAFLDPWDLCSISVVFEPDHLGSYEGELSILTSAVEGDLRLGLYGTGVQSAAATLSPYSLSFGDQMVGSNSPALQATLANAGGLALDILSIEASSGFKADSSCPAPLPAGSSCTIDLWFAPDAEGEISGQLIVSFAQVDALTIKLSGIGTLAPPSIKVEDLEVSEGESLRFAVTLSEAVETEVSVDYETLDDTAFAGEDYERISGRLVFRPGETRLSVRLITLGDNVLESEFEQFSLELSNPVGAALVDDRAVVVIVDDERCPGPEMVNSGGFENLGNGFGAWQIVSGEWKLFGQSPDPFEGENYLASVGVGYAEAVSDVDLSAYASSIASGAQVFTFEGRVSGAGRGGDRFRIVAEYRGDGGRSVLDVFDSGFIDAPGTWNIIDDERAVPPGTTSVRIRLISEIIDSHSSGVYFDGFSLKSIRTPVLWIDDVLSYEGDSGWSSLLFPIRLSCAFEDDVVFDFATSGGSATPWVDYEENSGRTALPAGETLGRLAVVVLSDIDDEAHEDINLVLTDIGPASVVPLMTRATGWIFNDDFCAQPVSYWLENQFEWPVEYLVMGGEEFDRDQLGGFLKASDREIASALVRQLTATLFNLERGSDPMIVPMADEASVLLSELWSDRTTAGTEDRAQTVAISLESYNKAGCGP